MADTDRELLELAAKAAGIEGTYFDGAISIHTGVFNNGRYWNPIADDGDALRLASALCMTVRHEDPNAVICGWSNIQRVPFTHDGSGPWHWKEWLSDHSNDRNAAIRLAITRAAAAIGRRCHE